ncbi:MAG: RluA family pseudouridine synthase [Burkholderiaceae bacterium]|nr:RluA family pseudouridine synthase [Burkholderiaceae bacterium]
MNPAPVHHDLCVLHADDALLVLVKPAGLLSVPGRGPDKQDCLSARAQVLYPDALIVHRLDMATSGLMLMARGAGPLRALGDAFATRRVHKRYEAVVSGEPQNDLHASAGDGWNRIDAPLIADWPNRPLQKIDAVEGLPSLTRWRTLGRWDGSDGTLATRVLLEPVTGRSHQLRVHLMSIGHPILGDAFYAPPAVQALSPRLLLHASEIGFDHPVSGESMRFESHAPF